MSLVVRTIRNGRVRLFGRDFVPDERWLPYDGRLDGRRFAFGVYRNADGTLCDYASLWGTEEMFRAEDVFSAEYQRLWDENPACVGGVFVWEWWVPVPEQPKELAA